MKIEMAKNFKDVRFIVTQAESVTEFHIWFLKKWEGFEDTNVKEIGQLSKLFTIDKAILILATPSALREIFHRFGANTEPHFYPPFGIIEVNWS